MADVVTVDDVMALVSQIIDGAYADGRASFGLSGETASRQRALRALLTRAIPDPTTHVVAKVGDCTVVVPRDPETGRAAAGGRWSYGPDGGGERGVIGVYGATGTAEVDARHGMAPAARYQSGKPGCVTRVGAGAVLAAIADASEVSDG